MDILLLLVDIHLHHGLCSMPLILLFTKTLAEAERQGRILRGEGDAESAKLFADAFSQDPGFYSFIRSLRAYEKIFQSNQDVMVLSPDSDFFRYMRSPDSVRK